MNETFDLVQSIETPKNQDPYLPRTNNLQSEIFLTLQTRHAQALVRGRDLSGQPRIQGLVGFADRVRLIWAGAQRNDPYADWWLIKIEDSISTRLRFISTNHEEVKKKLDQTRAIRITPAESKDPFRIQLRFGTPFGFRAASMLANFDALTRDSLTAKHIGMLTSTQCQEMIYDQVKKIRSLFNLPFTYRFFNVDRLCPESWIDVREQAERLMGVIPDDVLNGTRRARLAPDIQVNEKTDIPAILDQDVATKAVLGS